MAAVNVITTTTSKLGTFCLVTFAALTAACSSDVLGTGDPGGVDQGSNPGGANAGDVSGTGAGSAEDTTGSGAGTPAEVAALFAPPESDSVTPGSIFGIWATANGASSEDRLQITKSTLTLARKCALDGRIAYVRAKIRVSDTSITVLESKSTRMAPPNPSTGSCIFELRLDVEELRRCDPNDPYASYDCFDVEGTTLTGLALPLAPSAEWIKLSD